MKIYSEVGRGTSVKIYLPCIDDEEAPPLEDRAAPAVLPRARHEETVLIVEDEVLIAEDLRRTVVLLGYAVVAVTDSGEEAVQRAGELRIPGQ